MAPPVMIALDRSLLRVGERVCCALSGGADSVAMLLALWELNARKDSLGIVLSAVHVHHGLRQAEADADESFVLELCQRLAVPLTIFRVDTPARQAEAREGVEEAARALRYERFWSVLAERRADVVATAHTLDDQAETVLLKLLRGAWTDGLGGISPVLPAPTGGPQVHSATAATFAGGRIVRPLLDVRRAELEAFLKARGQSWREDTSNADVRFTRNRVRHQLLPELRTYNPLIDEALARTAGIARDEEAFWAAEVARLLPQLLLPGKPVRGGGRLVGSSTEERTSALDIARLRSFPPALQRRLLRGAAREAGVRLSAEETARLMALADLAPRGTTKSRIGAVLKFHGGLRVERSPRELRFTSRFGPRTSEPTEILPPGGETTG